MFEGTIVQNEAYKVKKLQQQLQQSEGKYKALQARYEELDSRYINETTELNERIAKLSEQTKSAKTRQRPYYPRPGRKKVKVNE